MSAMHFAAVSIPVTEAALLDDTRLAQLNEAGVFQEVGKRLAVDARFGPLFEDVLNHVLVDKGL